LYLDDEKILLDSIFLGDKYNEKNPIRSRGNFSAKIVVYKNQKFLLLSFTDFTNPSSPSDYFNLIYKIDSENKLRFFSKFISVIPSMDLIIGNNDSLNIVIQNSASIDTCWFYSLNSNNLVKSNLFINYGWYPDSSGNLDQFFNINHSRLNFKYCK